MPFDTTGNFSRLHNWEDDRINDVDISSDRHDEEDDNFAEGLTACVCKDGRSTMSGSLNMGGYRISNLANATASADAVNKNQLEQHITDLQTSLIDLINQSLNNNVCVGDIKASTRSANHDNWLLCNGQAVSRATYADLFAIIGTNFGKGNGVTTFNVPDYRGKFLRGLGGNSAANIYTTQAEGLPNITGTGTCAMRFNMGNPTFNGCFTNVREGGLGADEPVTTGKLYDLDASRSNGIYGASNHVTPINQAVNYFIKAKNTTTTIL